MVSVQLDLLRAVVVQLVTLVTETTIAGRAALTSPGRTDRELGVDVMARTSASTMAAITRGGEDAQLEAAIMGGTAIPTAKKATHQGAYAQMADVYELPSGMRIKFIQHRRGKAKTPLPYRSALLRLVGAAHPGVDPKALDSLVMERMFGLEKSSEEEIAAALPVWNQKRGCRAASEELETAQARKSDAAKALAYLLSLRPAGALRAWMSEPSSDCDHDSGAHSPTDGYISTPTHPTPGPYCNLGHLWV
ncbi:unnamed protein product [Lampetra fluviatilis]